MGQEMDTGEAAGSGEAAAADSGEETRRPVRQGEGSSTVGRRELRRQRVRRRRILALVGGVVLVVVLAFAFWYELEAHALGPEGQREVVQVGAR